MIFPTLSVRRAWPPTIASKVLSLPTQTLGWVVQSAICTPHFWSSGYCTPISHPKAHKACGELVNLEGLFETTRPHADLKQMIDSDADLQVAACSRRQLYFPGLRKVALPSMIYITFRAPIRGVESMLWHQIGLAISILQGRFIFHIPRMENCSVRMLSLHGGHMTCDVIWR